MTNRFVIVNGRRKGLTDLRKRLWSLETKFKEKGLFYEWDRQGSFYKISIKTDENKVLFEEVILTKGVELSKKIHAFLDIFENQLAKL